MRGGDEGGDTHTHTHTHESETRAWWWVSCRVMECVLTVCKCVFKYVCSLAYRRVMFLPQLFRVDGANQRVGVVASLDDAANAAPTAAAVDDPYGHMPDLPVAEVTGVSPADVFARTVEAHGDGVAIFPSALPEGSAEVSYTLLDTMASKIATHLKLENPGLRGVIGLLLPKGDREASRIIFCRIISAITL